MQVKETKDIDCLRTLMSRYVNTLKVPCNKADYYTAEIKLLDYGELGSVITNMLKLCILALDHEAHEIPNTIKNPSINVVLILELVLQLFPAEEFELISEINNLLIADANNKGSE